MCGSRSVVHMPMASSAAIPVRGSGMAHLRACRAAVDGKRRGNKPRRTAAILAAESSGTSTTGISTPKIIKVIRRLTWAAVAVLGVALAASPGYAQSGPFAGMAGNWSGGGTVTLDDGSTERIRCRATYAVGAGGNGLNQNLTCASDSYKFDLRPTSSPRAARSPGPGARAAGASTATRGTRRRRQFSGPRQRGRIHRQHFADDARQPAVRRDQVREPVRGASISLSRH